MTRIVGPDWYAIVDVAREQAAQAGPRPAQPEPLTDDRLASALQRDPVRLTQVLGSSVGALLADPEQRYAGSLRLAAEVLRAHNAEAGQIVAEGVKRVFDGRADAGEVLLAYAARLEQLASADLRQTAVQADQAAKRISVAAERRLTLDLRGEQRPQRLAERTPELDRSFRLRDLVEVRRRLAGHTAGTREPLQCLGLLLAHRDDLGLSTSDRTGLKAVTADVLTRLATIDVPSATFLAERVHFPENPLGWPPAETALCDLAAALRSRAPTPAPSVAVHLQRRPGDQSVRHAPGT